jgi:phosphoribosylamine--glycine ligase
VIEFNCRFGDPETQAVLTILESDFLELLWLTVNKDLSSASLKLDGKAVCLVLASKGYPDEFQKGFEIRGLEEVENTNDLIVFHAGTKIQDNKLFTNGGRVLNIVAHSKHESFENLIKKVYTAAEKINFENKYYRSDIGLKGLSKLKKLNS